MSVRAPRVAQRKTTPRRVFLWAPLSFPVLLPTCCPAAILPCCYHAVMLYDPAAILPPVTSYAARTSACRTAANRLVRSAAASIPLLPNAATICWCHHSSAANCCCQLLLATDAAHCCCLLPAACCCWSLLLPTACRQPNRSLGPCRAIPCSPAL